MSNLSFADLLSFETVRDGIVVRFNGRHWQGADARELADELFDVACKGSGPHLYLDLAAVESLSGHVLLRLMVLDKKLQDLGDRLVLLNTRARVREAIQASNLTGTLSER